MGTGVVESQKYHQSTIKAAHMTFVLHSKSSEDTQLFCVSKDLSYFQKIFNSTVVL